MRLTRVFPILQLICVGIVCPVGHAQQKVSVSNATWSVDRNLVQIAFDLDGDQTRAYEVSLLLLKEGDVSFRVKPNRAIGDFGAGIAAGKGKTIMWDFLKDFPERPRGADYFFQISVDSVVARTPSGSFVRESTPTAPTQSPGSPQLSLDPQFWNRVGDRVHRPFTARVPKGDSISVSFIVRNTGTGPAESLFVSARKQSTSERSLGNGRFHRFLFSDCCRRTVGG